MHLPPRSVVFAVLLSAAVPFAASAATLTVTQQGVVSASAPRGAQRAVFLEVGVQAGCDAAATVSSLTVRHRGLGNAADVARVYATDGETRLTKTRSLDASDQSAVLRFEPALAVKACATKHLQIRGDFSGEAEAGGEHGLLIEAVDAGDAAVTLSAPSKRTALTTRPASVGTVTASFLKLTKALQFGKGRTFARLRLDADNVRNHDVRSITLTNEGKATDADLRNLRIENRKGEVLTDTKSSLSGSTVTLTFDPPLRLDRNASVLLDLKGDIAASKSRTIRFVLEEPSDLEAAPRAR